MLENLEVTPGNKNTLGQQEISKILKENGRPLIEEEDMVGMK